MKLSNGALFLSLSTLGYAKSDVFYKRLENGDVVPSKTPVKAESGHLHDHKRLQAVYDENCLFENEEGTGMLCLKHQTEVRLGYELIQTTSTDEDDDTDDFYYWQIRLYPYAFANLDLLPYIGIPVITDKTQQSFYLEVQSVIESFDIGFFVEAVPWWDYSTTEATRDFCYSYGWATDEIDFELTSEANFRECYKTILYNLENPAAVFMNKYEKLFAWTACDASSSTDVTVWDYIWYETTSSQTTYLEGAAIDYETRGTCTGNLFAKNEVAANLFDIAVSFA